MLLLLGYFLVRQPKQLTVRLVLDEDEGKNASIIKQVNLVQNSSIPQKQTHEQNCSAMLQHTTIPQTQKENCVQDILYHTNRSNSDRNVFVVPRRVYYDNRMESGKPRNIVIILAEVHDHALGTILACELDGKLSTSLKVLKENTWWVRHRYPSKYTHFVLAIECIGLPQDAIFNGSVAKLIYKKGGDKLYSRVVSEKPLFLHEGSHNPSIPTKGNGSIVMCTTMYGHPDNLDQWLIYHKYLGVERVHFNAHKSFSENASQKYPFYSESLRTGFVQVDVWPDIVGYRNFYHSQILKYHDCLYHHIGMFEYGFFLDYDDFFNPIVPNNTDIHYYFSHFFTYQVGSVCMPWRQMKCGPIKSRVKDVPHGNLTSILSGNKSELRPEKKCAHRLNAAQFLAVHNVDKMLPGYRRTFSSATLAYVAHNRRSIKDC